MRVMAAAVVVLWILAGCGGDDDGPRSDASGQAGDDGAVPGDDDASAQSGDGGLPCLESAGCGGEVCCDQGEGGSCVPSFDDCTGLVLCGVPEDCPEVNPVCCPQGFCGGCD